MIFIKKYAVLGALLFIMIACGNHGHLQLRGLGDAGVPGAGTVGTIAGAVTLHQAAHNAVTGKDKKAARKNSAYLSECMKDYTHLDNDDPEKHEAINKCLQELRKTE
jgi:hypothetical protein